MKPNGATLVLTTLHHGERHPARQLIAVARRHRTEHEIHHFATDLARWSGEHVRRLAEAGRAHGLELDDSPVASAEGFVSALRETTAEALGHRPVPGLLLLRDLRELHLAAAENSLCWEMLAQVAQARRDQELLAVVSACHPRTLRQTRWSNTMIKSLSPQLLTSL